jgi:WD40 repeat protein
MKEVANLVFGYLIILICSNTMSTGQDYNISIRAIDVSDATGNVAYSISYPFCSDQPEEKTSFHLEANNVSLNHVEVDCGIAWIEFSNNGDYIVTTDVGGIIKIWDSNTFQEIAQTGGLFLTAFMARWKPDGSQLLISQNGLHIWDFNSMGYDNSVQFNTNAVARGKQVVEAITWHPQDSVFASSQHDGYIRVWNSESGIMISELGTHNSIVKSIDWHPNGIYLASGGNDKTVKLWDTHNEVLVSSLEVSETINKIAWNSHGTHLAVLANNGSLIVIDEAFSTQRIVATTASTFAWSNDNGSLIYGDMDSIELVEVKIFDNESHSLDFGLCPTQFQHIVRDFLAGIIDD